MKRAAVVVIAAGSLAILGVLLLVPKPAGRSETEADASSGISAAVFDRDFVLAAPLEITRSHDALGSSLSQIAGNLPESDDITRLVELGYAFLTDDRLLIESLRRRIGLAPIFECWSASQQREYEQRVRRSFRSRATLAPSAPPPYAAMSEREWADAIERLPVHELVLARDPSQPPPATIDTGSIRWTYTPSSGRPDLIDEVLSRHRVVVETLSRAAGDVEPVAAEGPSFWTLCGDGDLDSPLYRYGPFVDCIVEARFPDDRFGVAQFVFVRHPASGWIPAYSRTATWARKGTQGAHWSPRF